MAPLLSVSESCDDERVDDGLSSGSAMGYSTPMVV